jgi:hypothetical protein
MSTATQDVLTLSIEVAELRRQVSRLMRLLGQDRADNDRSIPGFCRRQGISRAHYYNLKITISKKSVRRRARWPPALVAPYRREPRLTGKPNARQRRSVTSRDANASVKPKRLLSATEDGEQVWPGLETTAASFKRRT